MAASMGGGSCLVVFGGGLSRSYTTAMKILYIGGTGQISFDCVHRSVQQEHETWVFNRGNSNAGLPKETHYLTGDLNRDEDYQKIVAEGFDVVCQFRVFDTAMLQRDIDLLAGKVGQYVFISSASAYHKPVTVHRITEDVPLINPHWEYSRKKADCEALLAGQTALPWTVVRPSHTSRDMLITAIGGGDLLASRMLRGKPVIVHGDGTSLWTVTAASDFAVPFVNLLGKDAALGEAFHITSERPYSWIALYEAAAEALGVEADIVGVPTDTLVRYKPEWDGPLWGDKAWSVQFDNAKVRSVAGAFSCDTTLKAFMSERVGCFKERGGVDMPIDGELDALFDRIASEQRSLGA